MSADVSHINATVSEIHPLLRLGPPGHGQGETQRDARMQDHDGASFSTSSTAFAETITPSQEGEDVDDENDGDHGQTDHREDDHHAEDDHDTQPQKASKPAKFDTARASHEHTSGDTMAAPRRRFAVLRYWILELLSLALAVCLLSAITVVLMKYNHEPVATLQWPLGTNLNSLIALMATFMRVFILVVVAAILGQTRWLWFQGPNSRALQDLQAFDQGSRGVVGSLGLLWTLLRSGSGPATPWTLGLSGAVVTVLSLTVGFFTQQAVNTVNCQQKVPEQKASLPVAYRIKAPWRNYNSNNTWGSRESFRVIWQEPDLPAAMVNGLASRLTNFTPGIAAQCPTGNCTFPNQTTRDGVITHASIGLCSQCIDTTKFAEIQNRSAWSDPRIEVIFPGLSNTLFIPGSPYETTGLWMIVGLADLDMPTSNFNGSEPRMQPDIAAVSWANLNILALTRARCKGRDSSSTQDPECPGNLSAYLSDIDVPDMQLDFLAASCSLYPCLKSYFAEIQSGNLNETLVSTATAQPPEPHDRRFNIDPRFSIDKSPCEEESPQWCHYDADEAQAGTIWDYMQTLLQGNDPNSTDILLINETPCFEMLQTSGFQDSGDYMGMVDCGDKWWLTPLWNDGMATLESISAIMDNLTNAVTNHWRATGDGPMEDGNDSVVWNRTGAVVHGDVWQTTVCLEVHWQWLLLPAALIATVAIMLVLVLASSYNDQSWPVWKESLLPVVLYGGVRGGKEDSDHDARRGRPTGERADEDRRRDLSDLDTLKAEAKETRVVFRRDPSPCFVVAHGK